LHAEHTGIGGCTEPAVSSERRYLRDQRRRASPSEYSRAA
jgi:hypothetical protein